MHQFDAPALFIQPGDTVIDCGAGQGESSIAFARLVGQEGMVVAIDPDPPCITQLRERLLAENLTNTAALRSAVSRHGFEVKFFKGGFESNEDDAVFAETVAIDDLIFHRPSFIRIDIGKSGLDALKGAAETMSCLRPVIEICYPPQLRGPGLDGFGGEIVAIAGGNHYDAFAFVGECREQGMEFVRLRFHPDEWEDIPDEIFVYLVPMEAGCPERFIVKEGAAARLQKVPDRNRCRDVAIKLCPNWRDFELSESEMAKLFRGSSTTIWLNSFGGCRSNLICDSLAQRFSLKTEFYNAKGCHYVSPIQCDAKLGIFAYTEDLAVALTSQIKRGFWAMNFFKSMRSGDAGMPCLESWVDLIVEQIQNWGYSGQSSFPIFAINTDRLWEYRDDFEDCFGCSLPDQIHRGTRVAAISVARLKGKISAAEALLKELPDFGFVGTHSEWTTRDLKKIVDSS